MQNEHMVPVVVKDIARAADKNNKITNQSEKFQAEARLRAIIEYCQMALPKEKK